MELAETRSVVETNDRKYLKFGSQKPLAKQVEDPADISPCRPLRDSVWIVLAAVAKHWINRWPHRQAFLQPLFFQSFDISKPGVYRV